MYELRQIFQMFSNTINELLLESLQHKDKTKTVNELFKLTTYSKNHIDNLAKLYKRKPIKLNWYNGNMINI